MNKKQILILLAFLNSLLGYSQSIFIVTAENGLILREKPDAQSTRLGKLPYGTLVEVTDFTEVKQSMQDGNKRISGNWVKIKAQNFPFLLNDASSEELDVEGYVFGGYLKVLPEISIETIQISDDEYRSFQKIDHTTNRQKITDLNTVKKLLKDKVEWRTLVGYGTVPVSIKISNGQKLNLNLQNFDMGFVAYYPEEEILLFEGGHTSDYSISVRTGETTLTVGNPEYLIVSPNHKIRLNGYFPGQECSDYFFQEYTNGKWDYKGAYGWGHTYGSDICYFKEFHWISDDEFIYQEIDYLDSEKPKDVYYKGIIK